jgi:hypothetical protein
MNATHAGDIGIAPDSRAREGQPIGTTIASPSARLLPRRDLVILPLLSILTIAFLLVGSELTARYFFPASETGDSCMMKDSTIGFRFRPNCTSRAKLAEGPWVTYQYNECGYRTRESCGPKPTGTTRIALIGSSTARGDSVVYDETFATRAATDLTRMCGHPVQVQNLGRGHCYLGCEFHRVDEALALKPDLVVMPVSPPELEQLDPSGIPDVDKPIAPNQASTVAPEDLGLLKRAHTFVNNSRAVTVVEHYLFQDPSTYLRIYLVYGDKADFLRSPLSPAWEERLQHFDLVLGEMAERTHAAHVPFVLIEMPSVAQASLLVLKDPPPKVDPYLLNQRLEQISSRHGIQFVNVLDRFRRTPGSNKFFFMVDGHMNGEGQALVSGAFVDQLTQGPNSALSGCSEPQELSAIRSY